MDNPQPYQPLSQALQSLPPTSRPHYAATGHHAAYAQHEMTEPQNHAHSHNVHPHAEEEEEEEDEDESVVEEQLNRAEADLHVSRPTSPKGPTSVPHSGNPQPSSQLQPMPSISEKRRPGRPRGSKNRKPRASAKNETQFYANQQGSSSNPAIAALPMHPNITPQNQPYYEFQWRMLNLCAEFYGAAEELVKATSPLVIAQSYQLGPGVKVDPLSMLGEAKRVCDTLLANPSHLVTNPPPPVYPVLPSISVYPTVLQPPIAGPSTTVIPTPSSTASAAPLITSATTSVPGVPSFVVPLNQPPYPQYPVYGSAPHAQYPTAPYYQYPTTYPYYPPPQPIGVPIANTSTSASATATTSAAIATTANAKSWSEEESERLRKLAEESKSRDGHTAKVDWEWVVGEWGPSKSRSQILRQANALNLKEATTRGTKRRREEGQADVSGVSVTPSFQPSTSSTTTTLTTGSTPAGNLPISSPDSTVSHSTSTTTPGASPSLQSQPRPSSSAAVSAPSSAITTSTTGVTSPPKLPWPMPTVAVQSAVSVLSTTPTSGAGPSTSLSGHDQRSSYYRPRPANSTDTTKVGQQHQQQQQQNHHHQSTHHYLFASNGHGQPHGGIAYRQKENGN